MLRKKPHLSGDILVALMNDVYSGADKFPADIRDAAKAQMLKKMDIEDARDAYKEHKFITPRMREKARRPDRVYMTDTQGNAWYHNCGWYRLGEDGTKKDSKPPMGHLAFRRRIKLATPEQMESTLFKYSRPWGQWRRGSGRYMHPDFGNVNLFMTDGVHAVILLPDGSKEEVMYDNLLVIGVPTKSRPAKDPSAKGKRQPKAEKVITLDDDDIAALDALLGGSGLDDEEEEDEEENNECH